MFLRLGFGIFALVAFAGQAAAFEISSPSVSDGKWAEKYLGDKAGGCTGGSVSIALAWKDPPAGTKSYALTMFDPDANGGKGFWHWLAWNIPASAKGLPEGAGSKGGKGLPKGTVLGTGGIGRAGYFGPCPPPGRAHHYVFTLYALGEKTLRTPDNPSPEMVSVAAKSQALGDASVTYTYGR